jgi:iron(III) transport system ATP-binding protein
MGQALREQGRTEVSLGQSLGQPFLAVRNLTKTFAQFTALNDINLDIGRGDFVCFLGPSGCGKTTLLRAIAGLDPQTSGSIVINGRDVSHEPPAARDFGIVFQSYALFPNLTIADNIGYGLVNQRLPKAQIAARVNELLTLVGLSDQSRKYPVQLSGGQQQRVALARALATSPGLLLLDEPLSALDARVRLRLREEIRSIHRRLGVTTIMVTHDQEEALSMAERIVVMNHGVIEQVGTPEEVYGRPATAFVADFVGRMNFLTGIARDAGHVQIGPHVLATRSGDVALPAGSAVEIGFRPEAVEIVAAKTKGALPATIRDIEFLGAFSRIDIGLDGIEHKPLLADVSASVMASLRPVAGAALGLMLPPGALRVFPARTGA